jgi:hypothetical protein
MANPTVTARLLPTGYRLQEGFKITYAFAANPGVQFWEKTVQPPSMDGGDAIEQTTQHNIKYRTWAPRALITLGESTVKAAYDPNVIPELLAIINFITSVTVHYPTNATWCFWGHIQKFVPDALEQGKQPEATITVIADNWDPNNNVEAGPVYTPAAGTA